MMKERTLKLTPRQQELMGDSIHNPERQAEIETGYIPVNATWKGWIDELADRDGYEPAEHAMWRRLQAKFQEVQS